MPRFAAAVTLVAAVLACFCAPVRAATSHHGGPSTSVVIVPPKAWILVDADSGAVLDAGNDRVPLPPASLTKLLTAVVAAQALQSDDLIPVSARAAGEPARKIGMKPGEEWTFRDALYCLLLSSANDAAAAIAERISGTLENFASALAVAGHQLGLEDDPVLHDPAGLDDNFSVNGGNLLSARDIAIIARAALAQPVVAAAVGTDIYTFTGPDGTHHRLLNHIHSFLENYPGAIGLKPGYTQKAGSGLALAARRGGRTLIAVVLDAPDVYASAEGLLDRGFGPLAGSPGTGDQLPAVRLPDNALAAPAPTVAPTGVPPAAGRTTRPPGGVIATVAGDAGPVAVILAILLLAFVGRRREVRRRRERRLKARLGPASRPG
jgi:D-alanyl-D-alanine carboxypeptidase